MITKNYSPKMTGTQIGWVAQIKGENKREWFRVTSQRFADHLMATGKYEWVRQVRATESETWVLV